MKRGGQVGAELHGQCDRDFSGQVGGIIHSGLSESTVISFTFSVIPREKTTQQFPDPEETQLLPIPPPRVDLKICTPNGEQFG